MSNTINQLLSKQAEAIRNKSNSEKAADLLEQAAKLIRGESPEMKVNLSQFRAQKAKAKSDRLHRFSKVIGDDAIKTAESLLTQNGWKKSLAKDKNIWVNANKPGVQLIMNDKDFMVKMGNEVIQPKTELGFLQEYVSSQTTKPKTV